MKLTKQKREEIKKAIGFFENVVLERFEGFDLRTGLCHNFSNLLDIGYLSDLLEDLGINWENWEGFEGRVPYPYGLFAIGEPNLYQGKNLEKRKSLSLWIIKELEKKLEGDETVSQEWEPEVGDWVYASEDIESYDDFRLAQFKPVFKLEEISPISGEWLRPTKGKGTGVDKQFCRKATPEEILKAKGIEEGKWVFGHGSRDYPHIYKVVGLTSWSYSAASEVRLATEEEILQEIAEFEVGEEVWSIGYEDFVEIESRCYHKSMVCYYLKDRGLMEDEDLLEKRPRPKWKEGDKCWHESVSKNVIIEKVTWERDHWRYSFGEGYSDGLYLSPSRPPQKFKVGDKIKAEYIGIKEITHIEWCSKRNLWKYCYGRQQPQWIADYQCELYKEPKKRTPKAGEVWKTKKGEYTILVLPDDQNLILVGYFEGSGPKIGTLKASDLIDEESYNCLGTFEEVFFTLDEINLAYSKAAPLDSLLHKTFIQELKEKKGKK